jgi:hypothetical protein
MITHVTATVVDGSLRLDQKLSLPDRSRVSVTVEPLNGEASVRQRDLASLIESFTKYSRPFGPRTWKREELYER